MVDLWGPDAHGAAQAAASRPSFVPDNGAGDPDTWYQDCSSPSADDGTEWRAAALNTLLAQLRGVVRKSGQADSNLDDLLLGRAIRSQRLNYVATVGGTANALTATLDPVPADWASLTGVPFRILVATASTAAATLNLNGLGARDIVYPGDNSPLLPGELRPGALRTVVYDGTRLQLVDAGSRARAGVSWRGMVAVSTTSSFNPATYGLTSLDKMLVMLWGGGGGATSQTASGGGGGGGGGFAMKVIDAQSATVTIGAGGAANTAGSNAAAGGTTSFGAVFSATGGLGATSGPGAGGGGVGGDVNLTGSAGDDMLGGGHVSAKGGSAPFMGLSGALNFATPPVGGGGSSVFVSGTWNLADNGGAGLAIIIY
jgi:hypothetical protein